jgi:putative peptidoglycan lipid II flippase
LTLFTAERSGDAFMPFLAATVIAPKFAGDPAKFDLTVLLARIMFPYLAAMSWSRCWRACSIPCAAISSPRWHRFCSISCSSRVLLGAAGGWDWPHHRDCAGLVGHNLRILQLGLLVWALRRRFTLVLVRPRLTPAVRRLLWLACPAAVTGGIVQINLLVGQIIASGRPARSR